MPLLSSVPLRTPNGPDQSKESIKVNERKELTCYHRTIWPVHTFFFHFQWRHYVYIRDVLWYACAGQMIILDVGPPLPLVLWQGPFAICRAVYAMLTDVQALKHPPVTTSLPHCRSTEVTDKCHHICISHPFWRLELKSSHLQDKAFNHGATIVTPIYTF